MSGRCNPSSAKQAGGLNGRGLRLRLRHAESPGCLETEGCDRPNISWPRSQADLIATAVPGRSRHVCRAGNW